MNITVSTQPIDILVSEIGVQGPSSSDNISNKWSIPSGSGISSYTIPPFESIFGSQPSLNTIYTNTGSWRFISTTWTIDAQSLESESAVNFQIRYQGTSNYVTVAKISTEFDYAHEVPLLAFVPPNCNFKFFDNSSIVTPLFAGYSQIMTWPI
jgi:hypothetical protein